MNLNQKLFLYLISNNPSEKRISKIAKTEIRYRFNALKPRKVTLDVIKELNVSQEILLLLEIEFYRYCCWE